MTMKLTHALVALSVVLCGNALAEDVLLIKIATGGTSLAKNWRSPGAVAKRRGEVGPQCVHMVATVKGILADLDHEFPEFAGRSHQVVGFGWHQGWQDGCDKAMAGEYEANMADFLGDVRQEFGANMAFVIANSGSSGDKPSGIRLDVLKAQNAMADAAKTLDSPFFSRERGSSKTAIACPGHKDLVLDFNADANADRNRGGLK